MRSDEEIAQAEIDKLPDDDIYRDDDPAPLDVALVRAGKVEMRQAAEQAVTEVFAAWARNHFPAALHPIRNEILAKLRELTEDGK